MDQVSILKQKFQSLSEQDKTDFLDYLNGNPVKTSKPFGNLASIIINHKPAILPDRPACAHCGSNNVVNNGHKDAKQRYLCRECRKTFAITNNTIIYNSKNQWKRGRSF